ncbi:MAG TPA: hypothetical protein VGF67_19325 [Ktedonobacteraceae bacterium]
MRKFIAYALSVLVCTGTFCFMPALHTLARTRAVAAASQGHVTILVLDMSGSMGTNDPQGLRCSAANAYIDLSGIGDAIGVVGLDTNATQGQGGPHNFAQAMVWSQPVEMATLADRQRLQQTIARDSHNCRPDGATPTYDALSQALAMLTAAAGAGKIPGSVILLTDGTPAPDTCPQITAIDTELLPQFQAHHWSVDTVALGHDGQTGCTVGTFHSFLSGIADSTSGKFYDDGHGVIPGVSPLNIASFFIDIFARQNGRTPGPTVEPTSLIGATTSRNFQLGNYVDHLDVVVVKDQPSTRVQLTTSSGQTLPPQVAGTFVSGADPYYAIFSVDGPQPGTWTVSVNGSGQFLMDSLVQSSLHVAIVAPSTSPALPLGQNFTVSARLDDRGTPISGGQFSITGTIAYTGSPLAGSVAYNSTLVLTDSASPGTYQTQIKVPENASPGGYEITISASQVSNVAISNASRSVRLERFPLPFLVSPQTNQVTNTTTSVVATRWDPALQFLYGLPGGLFQWLSQKPLGGLPATPSAVIKGVVVLNGKAYPEASVTATATRVGTQTAIPVSITSSGAGTFQLQFPISTAGTYTITFRTSGSFQDTHGDFGVTLRTTQVTIQGAALFGQEVVAWLWTIGYLLLLYLIYRLARFSFASRPFGEWMQSEDGEIVARHAFRDSRRNPLRAFWQRNILRSEEAGLPPGLLFRFNRGASIETCLDRADQTFWQQGGRDVGTRFIEVRDLTYEDWQQTDMPDDNGRRAYTIVPYERRAVEDEED